jgi:hypothetical protein
MLATIALALMLQVSDGPASTPIDALDRSWEAVRSGSARQLLSTLAPFEQTALLEISAAYLDALSELDTETLGSLFASVRLEAAPGEVTLWEPLDCLELLVYAPAHADLVSSCSLSVEECLLTDSTASLAVVVHTPDGRLEYALKAVRMGECWKLAGVSEALLYAIRALPEPWPKPEGIPDR